MVIFTQIVLVNYRGRYGTVFWKIFSPQDRFPEFSILSPGPRLGTRNFSFSVLLLISNGPLPVPDPRFCDPCPFRPAGPGFSTLSLSSGACPRFLDPGPRVPWTVSRLLIPV